MKNTGAKLVTQRPSGEYRINCYHTAASAVQRRVASLSRHRSCQQMCAAGWITWGQKAWPNGCEPGDGGSSTCLSENLRRAHLSRPRNLCDSANTACGKLYTFTFNITSTFFQRICLHRVCIVYIAIHTLPHTPSPSHTHKHPHTLLILQKDS